MHGADNDTFINLTESPVPEAAVRAAQTLLGPLTTGPGGWKGKGPAGLGPSLGRGQLLPSPPIPSPPRDRLNQALMDQRDAGADEIRAAVRA